MKKLFIALFILVANVDVYAQIPSLFSKTEKKGNAVVKTDQAFVRGVNVTANLKQILSYENQRFIVITPNGEKLTIIKRREENPDKTHKIWYGEVENVGRSLVMFSITPKAMTGHINFKDRTLRVSYVGNGVHQIAEIDASKFKENTDDKLIPENIGQQEAPKDCPDSPVNIDILVVYTAAAVAGAGGADGMEALVYESVYRTNLSYENSNISQRLRIVHHEQINYAETGIAQTDLTALRNPADGIIDNVHTLRNTHGADVVVLITETLDFCGLGYFMDPISSTFSSYAFTVVKRDCAAGNLSFAHELGHNMGADHNCASTNPVNSAGIQHGFFISNPADGGTSWRTVMSYNNCTNPPCTRIPYFSNPSIGYSPTGSTTTDPLGTSSGTCQSDNKTRINNSASTVANFRCSSPGVNNVWMKDTWNDTGLEPDPSTAGEDMWRSPYIWIRNSPDPTFLNQHEHQNPRFGQSNWVYVKLQNGALTSQTGNLQLWVADASVSLVWQSSWTQIANIPVNLTANATNIQEFEWTTVPNPASGSSHYCMIARWVSATDPMHTLEGTDINTNVYQNNNIIWRNLNIVSLSGDQNADVIFVVENPTQRATKLVFTDNTKFPKQTFIGNGEVTVKFDQKLIEIWKRGGGKVSGAERIKDDVFKLTNINSVFDNLKIPPKYKGKVTISFKKTDNTPKNSFDFSVKQYIITQRTINSISKDRILGGVDYEIRNFNE